MKVKALVFLILIGCVGVAIASRANQTYKHIYPQYFHSWADFAKGMENIR